MRYHPGLAIGHAQFQTARSNESVDQDISESSTQSDSREHLGSPVPNNGAEPSDVHHDLESPELMDDDARSDASSMNSMDQGWDQWEDDDEGDRLSQEPCESGDDDDEYLELYEMYH